VAPSPKAPSGRAGTARRTPGSPASAKAVAVTGTANRLAVGRTAGKGAPISSVPLAEAPDHGEHMDNDSLEEVVIPQNPFK